MIVDDLDIECRTALESKADPPSVIDTNAVLTLPATFQYLEAIARRRSQKIQGRCRIDQLQLAFGLVLYGSESLWTGCANEQLPGVLAGE